MLDWNNSKKKKNYDTDVLLITRHSIRPVGIFEKMLFNFDNMWIQINGKKKEMSDLHIFSNFTGISLIKNVPI